MLQGYERTVESATPHYEVGTQGSAVESMTPMFSIRGSHFERDPGGSDAVARSAVGVCGYRREMGWLERAPSPTACPE